MRTSSFLHRCAVKLPIIPFLLAFFCIGLSAPVVEVALGQNPTPAMLEEAAWGYVNHPRGARFDARGQLVVSSIYRWYGEDFGGGEAGVLNHLRRHAGEPLAEGLARIDAIADDSYDWRLNDGSGLP